MKKQMRVKQVDGTPTITLLRTDFPPVLAELFRPVARFTVAVQIADNATVPGQVSERAARAGEYSKTYAFNLSRSELRNLQTEEKYEYEIRADELVFSSVNYRLLVTMPREVFHQLFEKESV
jgi:hypothetical protein